MRVFHEAWNLYLYTAGRLPIDYNAIAAAAAAAVAVVAAANAPRVEALGARTLGGRTIRGFKGDG